MLYRIEDTGLNCPWDAGDRIRVIGFYYYPRDRTHNGNPYVIISILGLNIKILEILRRMAVALVVSNGNNTSARSLLIVLQYLLKRNILRKYLVVPKIRGTKTRQNEGCTSS